MNNPNPEKPNPTGDQVAWFTFGQCHVHKLAGIVFDKDLVVKITSPDPRAMMFSLFGRKWAMQYDEEPDLSHFPRGVISL